MLQLVYTPYVTNILFQVQKNIYLIFFEYYFSIILLSQMIRQKMGQELIDEIIQDVKNFVITFNADPEQPKIVLPPSIITTRHQKKITDYFQDEIEKQQANFKLEQMMNRIQKIDGRIQMKVTQKYHILQKLRSQWKKWKIQNQNRIKNLFNRKEDYDTKFQLFLRQIYLHPVVNTEYSQKQKLFYKDVLFLNKQKIIYKQNQYARIIWSEVQNDVKRTFYDQFSADLKTKQKLKKELIKNQQRKKKLQQQLNLSYVGISDRNQKRAIFKLYVKYPILRNFIAIRYSPQGTIQLLLYLRTMQNYIHLISQDPEQFRKISNNLIYNDQQDQTLDYKSLLTFKLNTVDQLQQKINFLNHMKQFFVPVVIKQTIQQLTKIVNKHRKQKILGLYSKQVMQIQQKMFASAVVFSEQYGRDQQIIKDIAQKKRKALRIKTLRQQIQNLLVQARRQDRFQIIKKHRQELSRLTMTFQQKIKFPIFRQYLGHRLQQHIRKYYQNRRQFQYQIQSYNNQYIAKYLSVIYQQFLQLPLSQANIPQILNLQFIPPALLGYYVKGQYFNYVFTSKNSVRETYHNFSIYTQQLQQNVYLLTILQDIIYYSIFIYFSNKKICYQTGFKQYFQKQLAFRDLRVSFFLISQINEQIKATVNINVRVNYKDLWQAIKNGYQQIEQIINQLKSQLLKLSEQYQIFNDSWIVNTVSFYGYAIPKIQFSRIQVDSKIPPLPYSDGFYRFMAFLTSQVPRVKGESWNVLQNSPRKHQFHQYKQWKQHCKWNYLIKRFCGSEAVIFVLWYHFLALFPQGSYIQIVQYLWRHHKIRVGLIRQYARQFNQIYQNALHFVIQINHIYIINYSQVKYFVQTKSLKPRINLGRKKQRIMQLQKQFQEIQIPFLEKETILKQWSPLSYSFRKNILFLDIQCYAIKQQQQQCYLVGVVGFIGKKYIDWKIYKTSKQQQPIAKLMLMLKQMFIYLKQQQKTVQIWMYNGIKYEMKFLLNQLTQTFGKVRSLGNRGQSKGFSIDQVIFFRQARLFYTSGSLAQNARKYCKTFYKKTDFDITKIKSFQDWIQNKQQIILYNTYDCLALFQLVQRYYSEIHAIYTDLRRKKHLNNTLSYKQLFSKYTNPQLSMTILDHVYFQNRFISIIQPLQITLLQRKNYHGGITCVLKHFNKQNQKVYLFDFNSMYPSCMIQQLPIYPLYRGKVNQFQFRKLDIYEKTSYLRQFQLQQKKFDNYFFLVTYIKFNQCFPFVPVRTKKGLMYPSQILQQKCLWGVQIRQIIRNGGKVQIQKCMQYSQINPITKLDNTAFRQYVMEMYKNRTQTKDQFWKDIYKMFLNSCYGKLAQQVKPKHLYVNSSIEQNNQIYRQTLSTQIRKAPQQIIIKKTQQNRVSHIQMRQSQSQVIGSLVRIAAYITASARTKLANAINKIGIQNVFYMDTDSLYVNQVGAKKLKEYEFLHDSLLGKMKLQKVKIQDKKIDAIWDQVIFISRKLFLVRNNDKIMFKSKGINWKGSQKEIQSLFNNLKKNMQIILNNYKTYDLQLCQIYHLNQQLKCQRWISNQSKDSNIIQSYMKKINIIFRRIPRGLYDTAAPKWEEIRHMI